MPRIVENTYSHAPVVFSYQHKVFKRNNRYYLFWADRIDGAVKLYYRNAQSIAGLQQAASLEATSTVNSSIQYGNEYDVFFDTVHDRVGIAWVKNIDVDVYELFFKYGLFRNDGSLDWQNEHQADPGQYKEFSEPTLGCAADGSWGIAVRRDTPHSDEVHFYTTLLATPDNNAAWIHHGNILPDPITESYSAHRICQLGSQSDLLVSFKRSDEMLAARRWNGTTLGSTKEIEAFISGQVVSGPVASSGGDVHLVTFKKEGGSAILQHFVYRAGADQWSKVAETDSPAGKNTQALSLLIDEEDRLHLMLKNDAIQKMHYLSCQNNSWQDRTADLSGELADAYTDLGQTPTVAAGGSDEVLVAWQNIFSTPAEERNEVWMAGIPIEVTPEIEAPRANFEVDNDCVAVNTSIQFSDTSHAGSNPISSWHWDFGDGTSSTEQHPRHSYQSQGSPKVTLTVSDGSLSDSKEKRVTVLEEVDECYASRWRCMATYFLGWLSGIFFLLFERKNKCIRFHAMQSTITFGIMSILILLTQRIGALLPVYSAVLIVTVLLWFWLIYKAWQGTRYKLPLIGNIAEKWIYG